MIKMNFLGIHMDCLSYEEMFPIFDRWLKDKSTPSHCLSVINVHICVSAFLNKKLRDMYNTSDIIGIDSMPFVRWARAFYKKETDRFYAPDLLLQVSARAKEKNYTYFLYGGFPGAPEKIKQYLDQRFEGITMAGMYSPPFRQITPGEDDEICRRINSVHPDFIWVGLGSPKQDVWIHEHLQKIRGSIFIPSGATFDFFSGRIRQAPLFIRNIGFEWLFRLTQDPIRLWLRYTGYNLVFVLAFFLQLIRVITFDSEGFLLFLGRRIKLGNVVYD